MFISPRFIYRHKILQACGRRYTLPGCEKAEGDIIEILCLSWDLANTCTVSVKDAIRNRHTRAIPLPHSSTSQLPGHTHSAVRLVPQPIYCIFNRCTVTRFLMNALGKNLSHVDCKVSPSGDRADRLGSKPLRGESALTVVSASNPHIPLQA